MPSQARWIIAVIALMLFGCSGGGGGSSNTVPPSPPAPPTSDTRPDSFSFSIVSDAQTDSLVESETVTISGINATATVSITGGEYTVNGGAYVSTNGTIESGQTLKLRLTSSGNTNDEVTATVTVGGVSADFTVRTVRTSATVTINNHVKHIVGGHEVFDRRKFITVHAGHTEHDWVGGNSQSRNEDNASNDLIGEFLNGFDVYLGRDTGGITYTLNALATEDPARPGFADPAFLTANGANTRSTYTNSTAARFVAGRPYQNRSTDHIVGAQLHPFWPDGRQTGNGWAFSQADTVSEPFGTATGEYMGRYLVEHFNRDASDALGQLLPKYIEILNEPLYFLYDTAQVPEDLTKIFTYHATVAKEIRNQFANTPYANQADLDKMMIGGYVAAFPEFDNDNFQRWLDVDKLFIDIAGDEMDYVSIHMYDFPAISQNGQIKTRNRKGSNMEATLDMLDHYTTLKFGAPMPVIVSEYGAAIQTKTNQPWSPDRDWDKIKSTNSQLMQYMERPDTILKTIPFIVLKAEWGRISETIPYASRLLRQEGEPASASGKWIFTELVKFYDLWSDVTGTRVDTISDDPDIMIDAYVDGQVSYTIINSLETDIAEVNFQNRGDLLPNVQSVTVEHLYWDGNDVVLDTQAPTQFPESLVLAAEGTIIIKTEYDAPLDPVETSVERKVYAAEMLQPITANQSIRFSVDSVSPSTNGEAVLRVGMGRDHGLSLSPTVTLNANPIAVPADWRGDDQFLNGDGHENFFGVLEIPVPFSSVADSNIVEITFPDTGGHVSSVALQVFDQSIAISR